MSASIETRLRRLEAKATAQERPPVVVIQGTDAEYDAKMAEAYASGLAREGDLVVYIREFGRESDLAALGG